MTHQTAFRASLFLPLVLIGFFELGFVIAGPAFSRALPDIWLSFWLDTKSALPLVGIQYVVLAAFMFWGIDRWSLRNIKIQLALQRLPQWCTGMLV